MQTLRVKCLRTGAKPPHYASASAAGADLYACLDAPMTIAPGQTVFLPTGIALEIPAGFAGLIYARSGLACKQGLAPANKVGVIDPDYRGEVLIALHNHSDAVRTVEPVSRSSGVGAACCPYTSASYSRFACSAKFSISSTWD